MALKTKIVTLTMLGLCGMVIIAVIACWGIERFRADYANIKKCERANGIIYELEFAILKNDAAFLRSVRGERDGDAGSNAVELLQKTDEKVAARIADLRKMSSGADGRMPFLGSALLTFEEKWKEYARDILDSRKNNSVPFPEDKRKLRNSVDESVAYLRASVKQLRSELDNDISRRLALTSRFILFLGVGLFSLTSIIAFLQGTMTSARLNGVVVGLIEFQNTIDDIANYDTGDKPESTGETASIKAALNTQVNVLTALIEELVYIISGKRRKMDASDIPDRAVFVSRDGRLAASDIIPLGEDDDF